MREVTKAELIKAISKKVQKASPSVKRLFMSHMRYQNKATLRKILANIKVTGRDIDSRKCSFKTS